MKYTINVNQKTVVRISSKLDIKDAAILDWISIFANSGEMETILHNGKPFFRIAYSYLIEELPLLKIKSEDGVYRRLKKLQSVGLLDPHPDNGRIIEEHNGRQISKVFWGFGPRYMELHSSSFDQGGRIDFRRGSGYKSGGGPDINPTDTYTNSNPYTILLESLEENFPLLAKRLSKKKEDLQYGERIVEIVDHFREVADKPKTGYHTQEPLRLMLRWLKEGYSVEDFKLVIDYKTWYFSRRNPSPEYIALDTYFREKAFESNLEKAKDWKVRREEDPEGDDSTVEVQPETERIFERLNAWYQGNPKGKHLSFTPEDLQLFFDGRVDSELVRKAAGRTEYLTKAFRQSVENLFRKGIIEGSGKGKRLIELVVKNIEITNRKLI